MTVSQKQRRHRRPLAEIDDAQAAQVGLERIINRNDLDSIKYLLKGTFASHSICRIQLRDMGSSLVGYASRFLVGPGWEPVQFGRSERDATDRAARAEADHPATETNSLT
jgi:hypothetical protein